MATFSRIKGILFLLLSAIIISAESPTLAKLIEQGRNHLINGNNPISFCNVLFASSFIALITLVILYFKQLKSFDYTKMSGSSWSAILATALFSGTLIPILYFLGIQYGNIINVVLISTLEAPLYILAGWFFLQQKPRPLIMVASMFTSIGVVLMILLQQTLANQQPLTHVSVYEKMPYFGELLILLAVFIKTIATVIVYKTMKDLPNSIFNVLSMSFGVIFFFCVVMVLFGAQHFVDLFSPFLWQWMIFYGVIIIALRVYIKFIGMQSANMAEVALSNALVPFSAVFFSYLILGIIPQSSQYIGGFFIILGILLALWDKLTGKHEYP